MNNSNYSINSTTYQCWKWDHSLMHMKTILFIFKVVTPIAWIIGLIGNILGLILALTQRPLYARIILTRALYIINLVNSLYMFIYPILDLIGQIAFRPFWWGHPAWKRYLTHFHFPIALTFINGSFAIYVLFAITQMIGTRFPMFYRAQFSPPKIRWFIVGSFFYILIWFLPSAWWFETVRHNKVCGFPPETIIYVRKFTDFSTKREENSWMAYGICREMITKIIPIVAIIMLKCATFKQHRTLLGWKIGQDHVSTTAHTLEASSIINDLTHNKKLEVSRGGSVMADDQQTLGPEETDATKSIQGSFTTHTTALGNKIGLHIRRKRPKSDRRTREYKISVRMLWIMMVQFIVFLLPVSVYMILVDFLTLNVSSKITEVIFAICTLLQYFYTSFNFYLNFIFNPEYRIETLKILKKSKFGLKMTDISTVTTTMFVTFNTVHPTAPSTIKTAILD